jgi:sugar fermentation stimulation protein A
MRFDETLVKSRFIERRNRFCVIVELRDCTVRAHLANSGRLRELLVPGRTVYCSPASSPDRKTDWDLRLVETETGVLVSVDARLPNTLFKEAFLEGELPCFSEYASIEAEVTTGDSRLDFRLTGAEQPCWVETKSITLVKGATGFFPDAKTLRGTRHVQHLTALKQSGARAAVIFVVQRSDAEFVKPNDASDPVFGKALREAVSCGVEVFAARCRVGLEGVWWDTSLPVRWD